MCEPCKVQKELVYIQIIKYLITNQLHPAVDKDSSVAAQTQFFYGLISECQLNNQLFDTNVIEE